MQPRYLKQPRTSLLCVPIVIYNALVWQGVAADLPTIVKVCAPDKIQGTSWKNTIKAYRKYLGLKKDLAPTLGKMKKTLREGGAIILRLPNRYAAGGHVVFIDKMCATSFRVINIKTKKKMVTDGGYNLKLYIPFKEVNNWLRRAGKPYILHVHKLNSGPPKQTRPV